jgi:hypothetical protein
MPDKFNTADAWKKLTVDQRQQALQRMASEQKEALASQLGYKSSTKFPKPVSSQPVQPEAPKFTALQRLTTPITEQWEAGRKSGAILESLQDAPTTLADLKWRNEHPVQNIVRQYLAGVETRAADMASPLAIALAAIPGAEAEGVLSKIPGMAQLLRGAKVAIPATFGAQGAKQVFEAATDSEMTPDEKMRAILGGSAQVLGSAGLLDLLNPKLSTGIEKGIRTARRLPEDIKMFVRPKSSSAIVSPIEVQAEGIAKAILPPGGIRPELLKSIRNEAPHVVDYARRTNNPMNTMAEVEKASRGLAEEGKAHYYNEIFPNAASSNVDLPKGLPTDLVNPTVAELDSRIGDLNAELTNLEKARSQGQIVDELRKSAAQKELRALRPYLYRALHEVTGIPETQIQFLREGYGGAYNLADQIEMARNARMTRAGSASQGGATGIPGSKTGLLESGLKKIRGGEEAIADRQIAGRIKQVNPEPPTRPMPSKQRLSQRATLRESALEKAEAERNKQALRHTELLKPAREIQAKAAQSVSNKKLAVVRNQMGWTEGLKTEVPNAEEQGETKTLSLGERYSPDTKTAQRQFDERLEARKQAKAAREQAEKQAQETRRTEAERRASLHGKSTLPAMTKEQFLSKYPTEEQLVNAAKEPGRTVADIAEIKKALAQLRAQKIR